MKPRPAVFLDRDGVINKDNGYVCSIEEVFIFPYVRDCITKLHDLGYYAIVISNQSGIARGYLTEETLIMINKYIRDETGIDEIYYCPFYPDGVVEEYSRKSTWRKPETGMIMQACRDYPIDLERSMMVGDRASDIRTGENAGITTVLLESGFGTERLEEPVKPDHIFNDLRDVVGLCKRQNELSIKF